MNDTSLRQLTVSSLLIGLVLAVSGCAVPSIRPDTLTSAADQSLTPPAHHLGATQSIPPSVTGSQLAPVPQTRPQPVPPNQRTIQPVAYTQPQTVSAPTTQPQDQAIHPTAVGFAGDIAPVDPGTVEVQAGHGNPIDVTMVGHFAPAQLQGSCGNAACGCRACAANGCQPPRPFGYVMHSPQGWNAYGIDPQEFLCDGGDRGAGAKLRKDETIAGLGLEDTVVHYTTEAGDIHFQASNRACLYAPRFISVRKITGALAGGRTIGPTGVDRPTGPIRVEHDLPGLVVTESTELAHADVSRRIDAMRERNRGVPVEGVQQLEEADDVMAALAALKLYDLGQTRINELAVLEKLAQAAVPWTFDNSLEVTIQTVKPRAVNRDESVEALTTYEFPDAGRLRIVKLADRADALPGEIVKFTLRVDNVGDSPVNHVVLADNLTTRLEYVPDSQSVEGAEADFSTVTNEGQSLKLQWELKDEIKVGESVTIHFECKVR